ncbi:MAG: hypothetical protein NC311_14225, partial [Muribaculaceae bacterium]|nr:hypothetical protein [Muribaculaceae bacterium]
SGVRQQWYTMRVYQDDTDTTLTGNRVVVEGSDLTLDGVTGTKQTLSYATDNTGTVIVGDRTPVNLTVDARNGLAMVVLQDSEGKILGAQRGSAVFQSVPVSKLGENRYTVTVFSARDYMALREIEGADLDTKLQSLIDSGKLEDWMDKAQFKSQYHVVLDYYSADDTGLVSISLRDTNSSYVDAQAIDLGNGQVAYLSRLNVSTVSAGYRITTNNSKQTVDVRMVAADGTGTVSTTHFAAGARAEGYVAVPAGISQMEVTVTSASGTATETYTVYIIRAAATVLELKVNGLKITPTMGSYRYTAPVDAKQLRVEVTANSGLAMVSINNGPKRFLTDWADIALNLTNLPPNNTKSIPISIYTYTGGSDPFNSTGVSTTQLIVTRDTTTYRPSQVRFTAPGATSATTLAVEGTYGRYMLTTSGSVTSGVLDVVTSGAEHEVVLHDYTNDVDLPYTVDYNTVDGKLVNRTFHWNLTDLDVSRIYNLTVYNNRNNGEGTSYPLAVVAQNNNVALKAIDIDRGQGTAQSVDISMGGNRFTADVDRNQTSAVITFTASDPNATVIINGRENLGQMDVNVNNLTGSGANVIATIKSSDGTMSRDYTLSLAQPYLGGALASVAFEGTLLAADGDAYSAQYIQPGMKSLIVTATEGGTIEVRDAADATVTGTVTPGRWNGQLDLTSATATRTDYTIWVAGEKRATLTLQRADYPTGIHELQIAHGSTEVVAKNGVTAIATNGNWQPIAAQQAYDPAGNAFTYYEASIGADDKWLEIEVAAMDPSTKITLGYNFGTNTGDAKGILDQNYNADLRAVYYSNINGGVANSVVAADGKGHFAINLEKLTHLSRTMPGNVVNEFTSATFKDVYIDIIVTTVDNVSRTYTLHVTRVNDDDSLRLIKVNPEDPQEAAKLYDNLGSTADEGWLGKLDVIKTVDELTGEDLYRVLIGEVNDKFDLTLRATDDAAQLTVSEPGESAKDPGDGDSSIVSVRSIPMEGEMLRFEIKVKAEDAAAGDYKVSYLQVYRTSDDATLKDAQLTFDFQDWTYDKDAGSAQKGQTEPMTVHGVLEEDNDLNPYGTDGLYRFTLSVKRDPFLSDMDLDDILASLDVKDAIVTAIANKLAAQVEFVDNANHAVSLTGQAWGKNAMDHQTVQTGSTYTVKVTPSSGNLSKVKYYTFEFAVVDLELDTLKVDGESYLHSYFVDDVDGEDKVVYYAVVPAKTDFVELEVQTHNNHTLWPTEEMEKASTLTVSDLESTVRDPNKNDGSRVYRQTQRLVDEVRDASGMLIGGESSQFQIKVGNYLVPGDDTTRWLTNTKYLRIYRASSETRMQKVIVYYEDQDTGEIIAVPAAYDPDARQYSAFVPDYVDVADIELFGPSDLSYLKLTPGMDEPARKHYIVRDADTPDDENVFDLWVKAVDGTEGEYTVVIYKEDNTLIKVAVDNKDAIKRTEPYYKDDGEHVLYDALADGTVTAKVYAEATSHRALVNAGVVNSLTDHSNVLMPTADTAVNYGYWWPKTGDGLVRLAKQDYVNDFGVPATEVAIKVKANPGQTHTDAIYYLHIYKKDNNSDMARFTMSYVTDLGEEGTATVFRTSAGTDYTVVLPSTAVSATLTGYSAHPMASIQADLGGVNIPGTKQGIYDMAIDPAAMGWSAGDAHFDVTSTDGGSTSTYTVRIEYADLSIHDLTVTDHYDPLTTGQTKVSHPSMSYQTLANELTRYFEALVGDEENGQYNGDITVDYDIQARGGAQVTVRVDGGAEQPSLPTNSLEILAETLAANTDLQTLRIKVANSVLVKNVYDSEHSSFSNQWVDYEAEYQLNVYRYSSNAEVLEVRFDYIDGGMDTEQYGIFAKNETTGDYDIDPREFVVYLPSDVDLGDLTITTASAGARVALSTKPFTMGAVGVDFTRNQVTMMGVPVGDDEFLYAYVLPSNNRVDKSKVYTIHIKTLDMDLDKANITYDNTYTELGVTMTKTGQEDNDALTLLRTVNMLDSSDCDVDPSKNHTHVYDKEVKVYEVHLANNETETIGTTKTYKDVIDVVAEIAARSGASVTVGANLYLEPDNNPANSLTPEGQSTTGTWNIQLLAEEQAYTLVKVTVTGDIYAADGADDSAARDVLGSTVANVHTSNALERVFFLKLLRVDNDYAVKPGATYSWDEADDIHVRDFYTEDENPGYINYIPEASTYFGVQIFANSESAKIDVQIYDA